MNRPAANLTETPGRVAVIITPDRILYSDGTTTLWRPSGPVTFRSSPRLTANRHGARWIAYSDGRLRRADALPPADARPLVTFRAPAGTIAGTAPLAAVLRFRSLPLEGAAS